MGLGLAGGLGWCVSCTSVRACAERKGSAPLVIAARQSGRGKTRDGGRGAADFWRGREEHQVFPWLGLGKRGRCIQKKDLGLFMKKG